MIENREIKFVFDGEKYVPAFTREQKEERTEIHSGELDIVHKRDRGGKDSVSPVELRVLKEIAFDGCDEEDIEKNIAIDMNGKTAFVGDDNRIYYEGEDFRITKDNNVSIEGRENEDGVLLDAVVLPGTYFSIGVNGETESKDNLPKEVNIKYVSYTNIDMNKALDIWRNLNRINL